MTQEIHILIEYLYVNVVGSNRPPPSNMNEYRYIIVYTVIYRRQG